MHPDFFNALPLTERWRLLNDRARFVMGARIASRYRTFYAFADYWLELKARHPDNEVIDIVAFRDGERLDYLLNLASEVAEEE